jgi:hypothetical protein
MKREFLSRLNYTSNCLLFISYCLLMVSCGGGLTDEQRKKIKEEMETSRIKRVSEAELIELAYAKGRELAWQLGDTSLVDSLATASHTRITWVDANSTSGTDIENQLIEAYLNSFAGGEADNVQKTGMDSLLYTSPVTSKRADGITELKGMWCIYLSRKQLILSIPE